MDANALSYAGNFILGGGWLATMVFGGKKAYRDQLIKDLKDLVEAQGRTIDMLKEQNRVQQRQLEEAQLQIKTLQKEIRRGPGRVHPAAARPPA